MGMEVVVAYSAMIDHTGVDQGFLRGGILLHTVVLEIIARYKQMRKMRVAE